MAIYPYQTEPLTDFSLEANQIAYQKALGKVRQELGKTYPLLLNGKQVETGKLYTSKNPSNHKEAIGSIHQASLKEAELAMNSALQAFETWKKVAPSIRADVLFRTAGIIRKRKHEFSAWMTLESGKPYAEADADTAEAIDFLEYYGRQMLSLERMDDVVLSRRNIERNHYRYIPLGVGAIIAPWNFPLAILVGMTSAAIVSGNTVIMKPAMTTQVIAYQFVMALQEAG